MRREDFAHKVVDAVHVHAERADVLIWEDLRAVHPRLVVKLEHDVAVGHARRRQRMVRSVFARHCGAPGRG